MMPFQQKRNTTGSSPNSPVWHKSHRINTSLCGTKPTLITELSYHVFGLDQWTPKLTTHRYDAVSTQTKHHRLITKLSCVTQITQDQHITSAAQNPL
jgi:hypothetical protein